jgi:hypothetical protein
VLTGYDQADLQGTGLVVTYYQTLTGIVRPQICEDLWKVSSGALERDRHDERALNAAIRHEIMASPLFGPLAASIIQMWYLGSWVQLPPAWRKEFGDSREGDSRVISTEAYKQSLIYDVMCAHPPGAKQPGFGSWSQPPANVKV